MQKFQKYAKLAIVCASHLLTFFVSFVIAECMSTEKTNVCKTCAKKLFKTAGKMLRFIYSSQQLSKNI